MADEPPFLYQITVGRKLVVMREERDGLNVSCKLCKDTGNEHAWI